MSITKKFLKTRAANKVTFHLTEQEAQNAAQVYLVGEFNKWDTASHPMKKAKNNGFSLEVELPAGKDFAFRYLTDQGQWLNDAEADAYVHCNFACADNFLVKV